jgi:hypothetical protein
MGGRVSGFFLTFTAFWLVLAIVAFARSHWVAGAISLVIMVVGAALLRYRWRNPLGS